MTVKRLRPSPSAEQLAEMYAAPHDHRLWGQGHQDRVDATVELALVHLRDDRASIADLSAGNGEIARRIATPPSTFHLGDIAVLDADLPDPKWCGPIDETIHLIPPVDVFVCSETIEHLDDPGKVLALIRTKAEQLVLSTPLDCWDDENPEHLWAWDQVGVEDLAGRAGWRIVAFQRLPTEAYTYGIWVMS